MCCRSELRWAPVVQKEQLMLKELAKVCNVLVFLSNLVLLPLCMFMCSLNVLSKQFRNFAFNFKPDQ